MTLPFLKWAGGKRWLVSEGTLPVPGNYRRYIEPFLGGGAVFFHLKPARALLSDSNKDLILLYQVMKNQPLALKKAMQRHQKNHSKEYYYKIRDGKYHNPLSKAARFLYLNRTCFNGLYRVNLRGEFNVPVGTKDTVLFEGEDFGEIARLLKNADIFHSDFEGIIDQSGKGDFVFVDPPYTVKHNYNNFLKYNETIFSWDDQTRLRDSIARASKRGAAVAITNADHRVVRNLYQGIGQYSRLSRYSVLAGKPSKRSRTTEALFTVNFSI